MTFFLSVREITSKLLKKYFKLYFLSLWTTYYLYQVVEMVTDWAYASEPNPLGTRWLIHWSITGVDNAATFYHTGADYFGPMFMGEKKFWNRGRVKVWGCIWRLSFHNCFGQFISRQAIRGYIYSDNCNIIITLNKELKSIYLDEERNVIFLDEYLKEIPSPQVTSVSTNARHKKSSRSLAKAIVMVKFNGKT